MSTATATETTKKIQLPSQYKVIVLRDASTPLDFIVSVLINVFGKEANEAEHLVETIESHGRAVVAVLPLEIARQKVFEALELAGHFKYSDFRVVKEQA